MFPSSPTTPSRPSLLRRPSSPTSVSDNNDESQFYDYSSSNAATNSNINDDGFFSEQNYATSLKGLFGGSGSDLMNDPRPVQAILDMLPNHKALHEINVVYLGTATYDIELFQKCQTQRFIDLGCNVRALKVTDDVPADMYDVIESADVIVVGGGNTLFALDRWRRLNLVPSIRKALDRGCVMTGGSAGSICWFDGGHSNSADPDTYKDFRVQKFGNADFEQAVDEIYATSNDGLVKEWQYIRIPALGFLPGLVSPHQDRVQSNGVLRSHDFDRVLLQTPGERGIAIDHWAALVIDGDRYRVLSLDDKEGTVKNGSEFVTDGSGKPGIWIKEVIDGKVQQWVAPTEGQLSELLRVPTRIVQDEEVLERCRMENPDNGPGLPRNFFSKQRLAVFKEDANEEDDPENGDSFRPLSPPSILRL